MGVGIEEGNEVRYVEFWKVWATGEQKYFISGTTSNMILVSCVQENVFLNLSVYIECGEQLPPGEIYLTRIFRIFRKLFQAF